MAEGFQFGLVVRGQAEPGEDIARRFEATLRFVREADRLGFNSLTKTAHYSAHPFQMLQLVPMLARFTAEAPRLRLNAGVVLLPLLSPLHVAEEFATLDVMSGGKIILGVGLGYRDVEFKAFGVPRRERACRFEDNLIAVRRLWTEDKVTMTARAGHFELDQASCLPKPLQKPHPPSGSAPMRPGDRARRPPRRLLVYRPRHRDRDPGAPDGPLPPRARRRREAVPGRIADAPRGVFARSATRRSGSVRRISARNTRPITLGIRICRPTIAASIRSSRR